MRTCSSTAFCVAAALFPFAAAISRPPQQLRRPASATPLSFVQGPDLPTLRQQIESVSAELADAVSAEDYGHASALRDRISNLLERDPQHRYNEVSAALRVAVAEEDYGYASLLLGEQLFLKNHLPQYQLAGLWRGLYPHFGEETIRIRYSRDDPDTLVAVKVTGDEHVPRGEVTFEANLRHSKHNLQGLEGVRHLSQMAVYPGKGQCASAGFQNPRFVDGELLLFAGGGLGFRWEPLGTTILFHRVDGMEAEVIEELEAARSSTCSGDSEPFDLVCTLDDILNGNSPL